MSFFSLQSPLKKALPSILAALPYDWRGTTFNNSNLLGRAKFCENVMALVNANKSEITTQDLTDLGNAEDYLRVSTNISCLLELVLAQNVGCEIEQVFSFGSSVMPIVAVALTASKPVHLYLGVGGVSPFTPEVLNALQTLGCDLHVHEDVAAEQPEAIVLVAADPTDYATRSIVDGFVFESVLYINKPAHILPAKVLVIRKRLGTPMTSPAAERRLQEIAGVTVTADIHTPDEASLAVFLAHLQTLSGTFVDPNSFPVCFTAGLPAVASFYFTLISQGGADILMASTSYGGSSELADICSRATNFNKYTYDITGQNDIQQAIKASLDSMAASIHQLSPRTVLFVEIPTNPDMKVPKVEELVGMLLDYERSTGKEVLLLVDTTFAPGSRVLEKIYAIAPQLTAMTFISMSKSVSKGLTTAGTIVAGQTAAAQDLLKKIKETAVSLDTIAKRDQMYILCEHHVGVEARCNSAYEVAVAVGQALRNAVRSFCGGYDMPLAFVTPEAAAQGFTSSTFSFNLPPIEGQSEEANEGLAQRFVDALCADKANFKPCVSFGQDNGLVYCTVPATSTQGAIKKEDKAKQAVGGVQLTRLSFPPTCNLEQICRTVENAIIECYRA